MFNIGTLALTGVWTGDAAAVQWWTSVDNVIPELTARWMIGAGDFIPGVFPFDRGPLQPVLLLWAGEWSTRPTQALILGVIINSSWVIGLWLLLRTLGASERRIALVVVLLLLTGPIWINTVYVWPKLLAAGLCLGCAAAILSKRLFLASALAGLALLAHGSAIFALIGLTPWIVMNFRWRSALLFIGVAAIYAPWYAASFIFDAPGQPQMIQWHFGGTDIGRPDLRNPITSVVDSYRHAGLQIFGYKLNNVRTLLGDPTVFLGDPTVFQMLHVNHWWEGGWPGQQTALGQSRRLMLDHLALSPGALLFGLAWWKMVPKTLLLIVASWALTYAIFEWGGSAASASFLHTAPLSVLIGWAAICAVGAPPWFIIAQLPFFVCVWLLAPPVWL